MTICWIIYQAHIVRPFSQSLCNKMVVCMFIVTLHIPEIFGMFGDIWVKNSKKEAAQKTRSLSKMYAGKENGSKEESEVAGFLCIFTVAFLLLLASVGARGSH